MIFGSWTRPPLLAQLSAPTTTRSVVSALQLEWLKGRREFDIAQNVSLHVGDSSASEPTDEKAPAMRQKLSSSSAVICVGEAGSLASCLALSVVRSLCTDECGHKSDVIKEAHYIFHRCSTLRDGDGEATHLRRFDLQRKHGLIVGCRMEAASCISPTDAPLSAVLDVLHAVRARQPGVPALLQKILYPLVPRAHDNACCTPFASFMDALESVCFSDKERHDVISCLAGLTLIHIGESDALANLDLPIEIRADVPALAMEIHDSLMTRICDICNQRLSRPHDEAVMVVDLPGWHCEGEGNLGALLRHYAHEILHHRYLHHVLAAPLDFQRAHAVETPTNRCAGTDLCVTLFTGSCGIASFVEDHGLQPTAKYEQMVNSNDLNPFLEPESEPFKLRIHHYFGATHYDARKWFSEDAPSPTLRGKVSRCKKMRTLLSRILFSVGDNPHWLQCVKLCSSPARSPAFDIAFAETRLAMLGVADVMDQSLMGFGVTINKQYYHKLIATMSDESRANCAIFSASDFLSDSVNIHMRVNAAERLAEYVLGKRMEGILKTQSHLRWMTSQNNGRTRLRLRMMWAGKLICSVCSAATTRVALAQRRPPNAHAARMVVGPQQTIHSHHHGAARQIQARIRGMLCRENLSRWFVSRLRSSHELDSDRLNGTCWRMSRKIDRENVLSVRWYLDWQQHHVARKQATEIRRQCLEEENRRRKEKFEKFKLAAQVQKEKEDAIVRAVKQEQARRRMASSSTPQRHVQPPISQWESLARTGDENFQRARKAWYTIHEEQQKRERKKTLD